MKKSVKFLCAILALLMMLPVFAACNFTADPPEQDTGEQTEEPRKDPITVNAKYSVVSPEEGSVATAKLAEQLGAALTERLGESVEVKKDARNGNPTASSRYEILVGQTNRAESVSVLANIKYHDYSVTLEGNKLVINAYTDEKLTEAVEYVIGLIGNSKGEALVLTHDDQKTLRAEYRFDTVKIGERDLAGYSIVIPRMSSTLIQNEAAAFQQSIIEASGLYLPIKDDTSKETDKEILVGNTQRERSQAVKARDLGEYGFLVKLDGDGLIVKANDSNFTLMKTLRNLANEICASGKLEEKTGTLTLSSKPLLTSFMFTDVHNGFAMLEPTNSVGHYVIRQNVKPMIDHLLTTVGAVDVVQVGGDLISDYPHWNKSGNWPYSYFVAYRKILVDTFKRLSKDGKVGYVAGNHDYAQGELATDGPGKNGSYNSLDFYFGDVGMRQDWGELPPEDMFVKIGEHTGEKYLLAYYYEVNGIGFVGLSADPDHEGVWSVQGTGFDEDCLAWLDKKLDEVDPDGNKVIFVNCHYHLDKRTNISASGKNSYDSDQIAKAELTPIFLGHKNLFHLYGHSEMWYSDVTSRYVTHHTKSGSAIDITGEETESTQVIRYENRDFTTVYGGHFRPAGSHNTWFESDRIYGYSGYSTAGHTSILTSSPRVGQGMYIEVFEDRIVFTMKNIGDIEGFSTKDLITSYTVYLYK